MPPRCRDSYVLRALAGALALAWACHGAAPAPAEPPRRIVSLSPALTEILFALGVGDRVVGVTDFCDYPPEARARSKVGGFTNPSIEAVLALEPQLVVVSPAAGNRDAALAIERAGVPVAVYAAERLEDAYAAIVGLGLRCGVEGRARELVETLRARLEQVRRAAAARPRPRVLFCLQLEPLVAAGRGTLPDELLALAGGINVVEAERYPRLGIESVLALAPEVIVQARMDRVPAATQERIAAFWSRWPTIPAVRQGRVYVWDATTALRSGPRVAEAAEALLSLLHGSATATGRTP